MSGGQQQRLSLACALVGRPELVFLDEPTAGLDAQSRHLVWTLIDALRADGVTVVLTTHYLDEAESLSDLVYIIAEGSLVAAGSPAELSREAQQSMPAHIRVLTDSSVNEVQFNLALGRFGLDVSTAHISTSTNDISGQRVTTIQTNPTAAAFAAVARACDDLSIPVLEISASKPTLEDIFLAKTGKDVK